MSSTTSSGQCWLAGTSKWLIASAVLLFVTAIIGWCVLREAPGYDTPQQAANAFLRYNRKLWMTTRE
jgi:hypothetical protein